MKWIFVVNPIDVLWLTLMIGILLRLAFLKWRLRRYGRKP